MIIADSNWLRELVAGNKEIAFKFILAQIPGANVILSIRRLCGGGEALGASTGVTIQ